MISPQLSELMSLKGKVALITGAGGHLGRIIAETLGEMGCSMVLVDRPETVSQSFVIDLSSKNGVDCEILEIDLEVQDERSTLHNFVTEHFGRLDILVNNAAFVGSSLLEGWATDFERQRLDVWRRALEVNLTAGFHLTQELLPLLEANKSGAVVNVGSIYGILGPDNSLYEGTTMANPAAYAASKGGLVQLTRWMATSLAPNIRVNCISPGGIERGQDQVFVERYVKRTPLRRMATESDFKGAICYLCSDMSAYVTGINLVVDGGWSAW